MADGMELMARGIVIKETAVGENDKILTLFLEGYGKVQAWARGSRKVSGKLLAVSSLFTYAKYSIVKRKDTGIITGGEVIETFFDLRTDIVKLALGNYLLELAGASVEENAAEDEILRLLLNTLHVLTKRDLPPKFVKAVFELRILSLSGYLPELHSCVSCGRESGLTRFDCVAGGLLCGSCESDAPAETIYPVSAGSVDAMRYIVSCRPEKLFSFTLSPASLDQLAEVAEGFARVMLERRFKTLGFYHSIV